MKVKRRNFFSTLLGGALGFVGSCLSLPACLRAKPPVPFNPQQFVDWYFERPEVQLYLKDAVWRDIVGLPPKPFEDPLYEELR